MSQATIRYCDVGGEVATTTVGVPDGNGAHIQYDVCETHRAQIASLFVLYQRLTVVLDPASQAIVAAI